MSKPPIQLSYESQKAIFKKFKLETRQQISSHCPDLQNLDSLLPIQIENLQLGTSKFSLNNTCYQIGVIVKYIGNLTPDFIESKNQEGGLPYDVDRYGRKLNPQEWETDDVQEVAIKQTLNYMTSRKRRLLDPAEAPIMNYHENVRQMREELITIYLKRKNYPPPFNLYIQIKITPDGGTPRFEYLNYDKPLKEVHDQVLFKIFGKERMVQIQNFEIGDRYDPFRIEIFEGPSLPVPYFPFETQRFHVKNMVTNGKTQEALDSIRPVLANSLDYCKIKDKTVPFADPIIQSTRFVSFHGNQTLLILNQIDNPRVHLNRCHDHDDFDVREVDWKKFKDRIGTFISIGYRYQNEAERLMVQFGELEGVKIGEIEETKSTNFPRCVILPLNATSELNVWCEETSGLDLDYCRHKFIVKMKVQPNGHATVMGTS